MNLRSLLTICLIFSVCILLPSLLHAGPGNPGNDPDTGVPFDGGLSLLIAAGVGYASKKAYDKRKKAKQGENIEK